MSTFRLGLKYYETCFRMRFQDASASRARASSVIVIAHDTDGTTGYGVGCPRTYVTGESIDSAVRFFAAPQGGARMFDNRHRGPAQLERGAPHERGSPQAW